jgi:hypothetical protein
LVPRCFPGHWHNLPPKPRQLHTSALTIHIFFTYTALVPRLRESMG